jgi:cephalosporin hydroxylase
MKSIPPDNLEELQKASSDFMFHSAIQRYSYNFQSLGVPIIQYPQDIVAVQELIWKVKPDLIIETGIAHGGSLIMSASMLALLDLCEAIENKSNFDPNKSQRRVLGIDIDIRTQNRLIIEAHPMASRISMIQGSSVDLDIVKRVREVVREHHCVLLLLDSNHTYEHVMAELNLFAPLVSVGSYCVVFDTVIDNLPEDFFPDRPWGVDNNPMKAVRKFALENPNFEIDVNMNKKLQISVAPDGYLKRNY